MIPEGWCINRLEELARIERGKFSVRPRNDPKYYGGAIPFVQTGDISAADTYLTCYSQTLNEDGLRVSRLFPKNTILITIAANIGDTAITTFDVACPDSIVAIQAYEDKADYFWLKMVLETCKAELDSKATQNAQKNINLQVLRPLLIRTPPLSEQKKIAKILSTWDKAINTTQALIISSKQQKKALMQQLLTGKKRFPGFDEKWERLSLKTIVSINYGKSPKEISSQNGCFYIVGTSGVIGNTSEYLCDKPAVVIGRKGTIDKPLFVKKPFWATDTTFYCLPVEKYIDIKWFYYLVKTFNFRKYNEASGVPSLSRETLYSIKVLVPQLLEQQAIATILFFSDKEIKVLQQKLDCLKQEKKSLMQQLLTGKRRVKIDEANMFKKEVSHD